MKHYIFIFSFLVFGVSAWGQDVIITQSGGGSGIDTAEYNGSQLQIITPTDTIPVNIANVVSGAGAPGAAPATGQRVYVNTSDSTIFISIGGAWVELETGSTSIDSSAFATTYRTDTLSQALRDEIAAIRGIDTLWSYTALRAYTGNANAVIVKDFTYTYSGNSYTTWGGLFYRTTTGTENGGTLIGGAGGVKWKRAFDGQTYSPMWWVVGGYNYDGTSGGILLDCMRINAASKTGGLGAIIDYPKDYIFTDCGERVISFYQGQEHRGHKTILRRKSTPVDTLKSVATLGDAFIVTNNPSQFLAGSQIVVRKMRSGTAATNNSGSIIISSISNDTIYLSATIANSNFAIGDTVINCSAIFQAFATSTTKAYPTVFEGLELDGNWRGNRYINDWRLQPSVETASRTTIWRNCNFVNAPCSNIWMGKGVIEYCRFGAAASDSPAIEKKMAGGTIHGSVSGTTHPNQLVLKDCESDSTNFAADSLNHDFSLFTFSSNNINVKIEGGYYRNGNKWIWAGDDNDYNVELKNAYFENFKEIAVFSSPTNNKQVSMKGGYYKNCGDITFANVTSGQFWKDIVLKDMIVINGRLRAYASNNLTIENNIFLTRKDAVFTGYTDDNSGGSNAYIMLFGNKRLVFKNNWVEADSILSGFANSGVLLRDNATTKVGNDYTVPSSAEISGNTIKNFQFGLGTAYASNNVAQTTRFVNWNYRNNTIISMRPYSGASDGYGIYVAPGAIATGNVIFNLCTSSNFWGMIVAGVDDSASTHDDIEGGIATNNFIKGLASNSILVGAQTPTTRNEHNAVVMYNICSGAVTDNTAGQSAVMYNTVMNTTLLPSLTSYDVPLFLNDQ